MLVRPRRPHHNICQQHAKYRPAWGQPQQQASSHAGKASPRAGADATQERLRRTAPLRAHGHAFIPHGDEADPNKPASTLLSERLARAPRARNRICGAVRVALQVRGQAGGRAALRDCHSARGGSLASARRRRRCGRRAAGLHSHGLRWDGRGPGGHASCSVIYQASWNAHQQTGPDDCGASTGT